MSEFDVTYRGRDPVLVSPIFISGAYRSGTTLLGNIIGSLRYVEYDFEPWLLEQVAVLLTHGKERLPQSDELQQSLPTMLGPLLEGYLQDILIEYVLGRKLNFRPTDDSRVWKQLPMDEVFRRWNHIRDRSDARREIRSRNIRLAVKMPGLAPIYKFLVQRFPHCQIIEIIRHGCDVARSGVRRQWFNDDFLDRSEIARRYVGEGKSVPWWVEGDMVPKYLAWSESTRALFHWRHFVTVGLNEQKRLMLDESQFLRIRFEDLVSDPEATLERIVSFLGNEIEKTSSTAELLSEIDPSRAIARVAGLESEVDSAEFAKAVELLVALGYEVKE